MLLGLLAGLSSGPAAGFFILAGQLLYVLSGERAVFDGHFFVESTVLASLSSVIAHFFLKGRQLSASTSNEGLLAALTGAFAGILYLGPFGLATGPVIGVVVGEIINGNMLIRIDKVGWSSYLSNWLFVCLRIIILVWMMMRFFAHFQISLR